MAFEQLHAWRKGESLEALGAVEYIGPDVFPLLKNSELRKEHELFSRLLAEAVGRINRSPVRIEDDTVVAQISNDPEVIRLTDAERTNLLFATLERMFAFDAKISEVEREVFIFSRIYDYGIAASFACKLFNDGVEARRAATAALEWFGLYRFNFYASPLMRMAVATLLQIETDSLSNEEKRLLIDVRGQCINLDYSYAEYFNAGSHREQHGHLILAEPVETLIDKKLGEGIWRAIVPSEVWTQRATEDLTAMSEKARASWVSLLMHCHSATSARPSTKWWKGAKAALKGCGRSAFRKKFLGWVPLIERGAGRPILGMSWESVDESQRMHSLNATILRGLFWMAVEVADAEVIRALGSATIGCYRKIRGLGPRAVKVGNAGVYALSQMEDALAVGQLALLKVKVKFGSAQKEIEKAFAQAAERSGLPREELEEMAVPTYGLTEVGGGEVVFGEGAEDAEGGEAASLRRQLRGGEFWARVRVGGGGLSGGGVV